MDAFPGAAAYVTDPAFRVIANAVVHPSAPLRLAAGPATPHADVKPLIQRLLAGSPAFAELWADHAVAGLNITYKIIEHPDVGRIELTYQTLDVRDAPGKQLTVATAPAGSPSAHALALLGALDATRHAQT